MLAKASRLTEDQAFKAVAKEGRQARGALLTVRFRETNEPAKYGLVVSTRVSKLATTRNLVKRRLRAAVHDLAPLNTGDVVVIATPAAARATAAELSQELAALFGKLGGAK